MGVGEYEKDQVLVCFKSVDDPRDGTLAHFSRVGDRISVAALAWLHGRKRAKWKGNGGGENSFRDSFHPFCLRMPQTDPMGPQPHLPVCVFAHLVNRIFKNAPLDRCLRESQTGGTETVSGVSF